MRAKQQENGLPASAFYGHFLTHKYKFIFHLPQSACVEYVFYFLKVGVTIDMIYNKYFTRKLTTLKCVIHKISL